MTLTLPIQGMVPPPKESLSQWWTSIELANRVVRWACVRKGDLVLEPSAGIGTLAYAARDQGGKVFCVEIDPALVAHLEADDFEVLHKDFLAAELGQYHVAIMNPPFEDGQTERHILHALKFAPRVVCIAQLGLLAGVGRKAKLWDYHTLKRMVVFSRRPKFSGSAGTAMRDFGVFEIIRGRVEHAAVGMEWW